MNDRYLYRAKHIHVLPCNEHLDGTWVIGYLSGEHYISNEDGDHLIDPETICQCTGLKDKNGKLIWENDIVDLYDRNTDYRWRSVVLFGNPNCEYTWGWQLKPIGECEANTDILCWIDMEESGAFCEVIGNIFDEGSENIGK